MIQKADTVGVFQIESRAQMSMLPRLKPRVFYDLVIEVAIVRPGPIQGDMVHPYLRRRNGLEQPVYVHPCVEEVLRKTLGVPLFQEQCMSLAVKAAGFTPGEADQLRRAMAAWKRKGDQIARFGRKFVQGMIERGIPAEFAELCFSQVRGFSEYGFPESHAASFALLVYASAYLKRHHPAEFSAALLNSQPMGFYAPAQLIRDAREHRVEVRPVDIHHSDWDCTIEQDGGLRLGMRLVNGLGESDSRKIVAAVRRHGRFHNLLSLWRASQVKTATLRRLASADAFGSMGLSRQEAIWQAKKLRDHALPLFDRLDETRPEADRVTLPAFSDSQEVRRDYAAVGLSLRNHPVSFVRGDLERVGVRPCSDLRDAVKSPDGEWVAVAGIVLVRQRPATAEGVTFMTIEDETGIANIVIWRQVYQRFRRAASARLVIIRGRVQREGEVIHVVANRLERFSGRASNDSMDELATSSRDFR
jgi:error-prone DNA polymerase